MPLFERQSLRIREEKAISRGEARMISKNARVLEFDASSGFEEV